MSSLLGWQNRKSVAWCVILVLSEVTAYVSDRLEFHHPGSGTEGQGKVTSGSRQNEAE